MVSSPTKYKNQTNLYSLALERQREKKKERKNKTISRLSRPNPESAIIIQPLYVYTRTPYLLCTSILAHLSIFFINNVLVYRKQVPDRHTDLSLDSRFFYFTFSFSRNLPTASKEKRFSSHSCFSVYAEHVLPGYLKSIASCRFSKVVKTFIEWERKWI